MAVPVMRWIGSSPRPWGCFTAPPPLPRRSRVFPTPVGVFPSTAASPVPATSLPHARGGVSDVLAAVWEGWQSSPRPWGCFPDYRASELQTLVFPTPVGVFPAHPRPSSWAAVFPTPVGVFPATARRIPRMSRLPHARGGVSALTQAALRQLLSSPRPWGCFLYDDMHKLRCSVFPTPVGVFPTPERCPYSC